MNSRKSLPVVRAAKGRREFYRYRPLLQRWKNVLNKKLQEIAKQPPSNTNININAEQMLIGDNNIAINLQGSKKKKKRKEDEEEEEEKEEVLSLWDGWLPFVNSFKNELTRNIFRPELFHKFQHELKNKLFFVQAIFCAFAEIVYSGVIDITSSEASWNEAVVWPVLKACVKYIRRENDKKPTFAPEEQELHAMTTVGAATSQAPYSATASYVFAISITLKFACWKRQKHWRTADTFNLATFEQLADVKYTFMHAHGDAICVWSFSIPKPQVLVMNKELKIPLKLERKGEELLPFLESCWRVLHHLIETIDALERLREKHEENVRDYRYKKALPTIRKI
ncbi:hypothetical protein VTP01DRAFT_2089, partial [Rhizomucor pusillus]|uniref:uncharacterized protein n=1 Tax=Rhizomucor pusillus TaxID=4840 RepID=UPI0037446A94